MRLYPAIDLKQGQCVRLFQGRMEEVEIYNSDPVAQARLFKKSGARWLHIVDLDGAIEGRPANRPIVEKICREVDLNIQLGGGIRSLETIRHWFDAGIERVILGTVAVENPALLKKACEEFPGRIVAGIDAREGVAMIKGWTENSGISAIDLAQSLSFKGLMGFIYTDIARDGTLQSPNFEEVEKFSQSVSSPVIASGGVAKLSHLEHFLSLEQKGIEGVICGKALYSGHLSLEQGLELFEAKEAHSC